MVLMSCFGTEAVRKAYKYFIKFCIGSEDEATTMSVIHTDSFIAIVVESFVSEAVVVSS